MCARHSDMRAPFGGHKQSGIGREWGPASYDFFTEQTTVKNLLSVCECLILFCLVIDVFEAVEMVGMVFWSIFRL